MTEFIKIVAFTIAAGIGYGILHDQVTAHLCVEYFTVAHPPVFPTTSPFLLAIGWGVVATWWLALPLGVGLAAAALFGRAGKLPLATVRPAILRLLLVMATAATISAVAGAVMVAGGHAEVPGGWAPYIPAEKHVAFSAAAWAHAASYFFGTLGGCFVIAHTAWKRLRGAPRTAPG